MSVKPSDPAGGDFHLLFPCAALGHWPVVLLQGMNIPGRSEIWTQHKKSPEQNTPLTHSAAVPLILTE